ncbi:MAG: CDP-diacylglycerol--serine O-phosphatidyltransferase, partial [Bacteroidia bacterium]
QSKEFLGLATPAATLFVMGLFLIHTQNIAVNSMVDPKWMLIGVSVIISALLVSNIPMFSFKPNGSSFQENKWPIIFVAISALLLVIFKWGAVSLIVIAYILMNIIRAFIPKS